MTLTKNEQLLAAAIVVMAFVVAAAALYVTWTIHTSGQIKTLGLEVYADPEGTLPVAEINWGRIDQGGSSETSLYCKLTGNTPSTLVMSTSNFEPPHAEEYLMLTWDYNGAIVQPGDLYAVKLILNVSPDVFGFEDFSFDILLAASEAID